MMKPGFSGKTLSLIVVFTLGFSAGWFSRTPFESKKDHGKSESHLGIHNFGYQFINPLLSCEEAADTIEDGELKPFQDKMRQLIDKLIERGQLNHVSVRFQEMNNGLTFGIHGTEKFSPASLLKVPYMIAYFKWAEFEPGVLKRKLTYEKTIEDWNAVQNFKPAKIIEHGKSYSIDELIFRSMAFSDNNANYLLDRYLPSQVLKKVYNDLGLELPEVRNWDTEMSVNEYARFFRILFNASYLTRDFSEKALKLLAEPDFNQGITAGVPKNIVVAQKYGERVLGERHEVKQLHDCGIVYYPSHPYLLCIMTRGDDFQENARAIRDISKLTFEEIDSQYNNRATR